MYLYKNLLLALVSLASTTTGSARYLLIDIAGGFNYQYQGLIKHDYVDQKQPSDEPLVKHHQRAFRSKRSLFKTADGQASKQDDDNSAEQAEDGVEITGYFYYYLINK